MSRILVVSCPSTKHRHCAHRDSEDWDDRADPEPEKPVVEMNAHAVVLRIDV